MFTFRQGGIVHVESGTILVGLNPALRAAFFPRYRAPTLPDPPPAYPDLPTKPLQRGCFVDRMITEMCRILHDHDGQWRALDTDATFQRRAPRVLTEQLIPFLQEQRYRPWQTQVVLGNLERRVGTLVDLVCVRPDGRYVLLEIKTGYAGYYEHATGKMRPPFHFLDDAPLWQHQVYLACAAHLFAETYPDKPLAWDACTVLQLTATEGLRAHVLRPWATQQERFQVAWRRIREVCLLHKRGRQRLWRKPRLKKGIGSTVAGIVVAGITPAITEITRAGETPGSTPAPAGLPPGPTPR